MSANTAELTLIVRAQNLAETELAKVRASISKITVTAKQVANDFVLAFKDIGHRIGRQLGNLATDILSGGDITNNLVMMGATMAGAIIEGLTAHLIPGLLARIAATSFFAPIIATFVAAGGGIGAAFSAAVAVGMAAMPFIILAVAVAALVYLATNPEARQKAKEVALMIIGRIGDGLRVLAKLLFDVFKAALAFAANAVVEGIKKIIGYILDMPRQLVGLITSLPRLFGQALGAVLDVARKIVGRVIGVIRGVIDWVRKALVALGLLSERSAEEDRKHKLGLPAKAEGGWVGLHGPQQIMVGERGPEYVVPNHHLNGKSQGGGGFTIQGVSEKQIMEMVDRGLYFKLQRAPATVLRS